MVGSKSTDKLMAMERIIKMTFDSLSPEKRDAVLEVSIEWQSIRVGDCNDMQAVPNLKIRFA